MKTLLVWRRSHNGVPALPALKYFQPGRVINISKCIWSGCDQADLVFSQAYPGMLRYEWQVKVKGRENFNDGNKLNKVNMLRLRMMVGNHANMSV